MFKDIIESRRRSTLVFDALYEVLKVLELAEHMFGSITDISVHLLLRSHNREDGACAGWSLSLTSI